MRGELGKERGERKEGVRERKRGRAGQREDRERIGGGKKGVE